MIVTGHYAARGRPALVEAERQAALEVVPACGK
jgi:hypothetical protein